MKGKITKTDEGWIVRYDVSQDDYSYPLPSYNFLPLHPDDVKQINIDAQVFDNIEARIAAYPDVEFDWCVIVNHDTGKGVEYAKLIDPEARKQALTYLANQAQKLNMGYESEWDELFEESEKVLNFELPLRYKNWLRNTYKKPTKNN